MSTIAGSTFGFQDGTAAKFYGPRGIVFDATGNLYVSDVFNNLIRKVSTTNVVSTLAGVIYTAGSSGWVDGDATTGRFYRPISLALNASGDFIVGETQVVRKVGMTGTVKTLAGDGSATGAGSTVGTGTNAKFSNPNGVGIDTDGTIYVSDLSNWLIRKVTPAGVVAAFVGQAASSGYTNAIGTNAKFASPAGMVVTGSGTIIMCDAGNHAIRMITISTRQVTTYAGPTTAVAADLVDGTGTNARFQSPNGIALAPKGDVYIADTFNHAIRKVTTARVVTTIAGQKTGGYVDDVGSYAKFLHPYGVALHPITGLLYVADSDNNKIRTISV
jgi:sugar lactone lactonase YvrE